MDLFEVKDQRAFPSTHALIIPIFKEIYERDADKHKVQAIKELTFIELSSSPKKSNPFFGYDPDTRYIKLKEELWGDPTYELDHTVIDAIEKYEQLLADASPTYNLLKMGLRAMARLKEFLDKVDYDERTNSGGAVYKPKDITGAIKEVVELTKTLEITLTKVLEELNQAAQTRKNREIGYFER